MGLECGECERDLRGGHAADCILHPVNHIMGLINEYDQCHDDEFRLKKDLWNRIQIALQTLYQLTEL